MKVDFEHWECREINEVITCLFDVDGFKGVVVSIYVKELIKYIEDEKLNWGYPLEPDDYMQICKPVTWWLDHKEDVIKQYITEKLK